MRITFALLLAACATTSPAPAPKPVPTPPPPPREAVCPAKAPAMNEEEGVVPFGVARIEKVCIFGEGAKLAEVVSKREGEVLKLSSVQEDLRALYALGTVRDVHISADVLDEKRVVLSYVVTDFPLIRSVKFEGATAFPHGELLARAPPGERSSPHELERLKRVLLGHYLTNGWADVRIDTSGLEEVTYRITEGQRRVVKAVRFEGNKRGKTAELSKVVGARAATPYRAQQLEADQQVLASWYYDRGMINAVVRAEPKPAKGTPGAVDVVYTCEEGDVYSLDQLEVTGGPDGLAPKLRGELQLKRGETFNRGKIRDAMTRMRDRAHALGFLIDLTPHTSVNPEAKTVSLNFEVSKVPGLLPF
ncbi:MAG: hypothetical protein JNK82_28570 [Myxococcaceae bacterium]|nr:hypothetical protein [Myxococcaceae bacterium]